MWARWGLANAQNSTRNISTMSLPNQGEVHHEEVQQDVCDVWDMTMVLKCFKDDMENAGLIFQHGRRCDWMRKTGQKRDGHLEPSCSMH